MLAAGAAGVAQGRDSKLQLASAADTDDTSRPTRPTRLRLAGATPTSVTLNVEALVRQRRGCRLRGLSRRWGHVPDDADDIHDHFARLQQGIHARSRRV